MRLTKDKVCSLLWVCKSRSLSTSHLMHANTYTQSFPTALVFIYVWQWLRVLFYVPTLPMISSIVCDNLHFSFPLCVSTSALPTDSSHISLPDSSFHHSFSLILYIITTKDKQVFWFLPSKHLSAHLLPGKCPQIHTFNRVNGFYYHLTLPAVPPALTYV